MGYTFVTVFFIISGALLAINYPKVNSCKIFYIKRWKTIFPSFYVAYAVVLFIRLLKNKMYLYRTGRSGIMFIFTLLGLDGYISSQFTTFYILGEWFLGAIILLYLLYPLIIWGIEKNEASACLCVVLLFFLFLDTKMLNQNPFRNLFSCVLSFTTGIEIAKHELYKNNILCLLCMLFFCIFYFVPLNMGLNLLCHFSGFTLFFVLFYLGDILMRNPSIKKATTLISSVSYEIFLVHHVLLRVWTKHYHAETIIQWLFELLAVSVTSYIGAIVLSGTRKRLVSAKYKLN